MGWCLWFDTELIDGIGYSSGPGPRKTIYGQVFLHGWRPFRFSKAADFRELAGQIWLAMNTFGDGRRRSVAMGRMPIDVSGNLRFKARTLRRMPCNAARGTLYLRFLKKGR